MTCVCIHVSYLVDNTKLVVYTECYIIRVHSNNDLYSYTYKKREDEKSIAGFSGFRSKFRILGLKRSDSRTSETTAGTVQYMYR